MTKKDYELIAGAIHRSRMAKSLDKNKERRQAYEDMARLITVDLATSLAHDNMKFNQQKFIVACGIDRA